MIMVLCPSNGGIWSDRTTKLKPLLKGDQINTLSLQGCKFVVLLKNYQFLLIQVILFGFLDFVNLKSETGHAA